MLDYFIDSILSIGIYSYILPAFLGFFIFYKDLFMLYLSDNFNKNASLLGSFFILLFVVTEYFSKTDIHLITDIIQSLETGHNKFSKEKFIILIFITSLVSITFWLPTIIAIIASFIISLSFPEHYIDFGFLIFIIGATVQTIYLIEKEKKLNDILYHYSPSFSYQEYFSFISGLASVVFKVLKIFG